MGTQWRMNRGLRRDRTREFYGRFNFVQRFVGVAANDNICFEWNSNVQNVTEIINKYGGARLQ